MWKFVFASGYHSCHGLAGVTRIIIKTFSLRTFHKTFGIMQNRGKAQRLVEPILLENIYCLAQQILSPRKLSLDLMR